MKPRVASESHKENSDLWGRVISLLLSEASLFSTSIPRVKLLELWELPRFFSSPIQSKSNYGNPSFKLFASRGGLMFREMSIQCISGESRTYRLSLLSNRESREGLDA